MGVRHFLGGTLSTMVLNKFFHFGKQGLSNQYMYSNYACEGPKLPCTDTHESSLIQQIVKLWMDLSSCECVYEVSCSSYCIYTYVILCTCIVVLSHVCPKTWYLPIHNENSYPYNRSSHLLKFTLTLNIAAYDIIH